MCTACLCSMFSNPFGVNYHSLPSVCLLHFRITKNALRMEFCCNILPLTFLLPTFRFVFCFHTNNEKILERYICYTFTRCWHSYNKHNGNGTFSSKFIQSHFKNTSGSSLRILRKLNWAENCSSFHRAVAIGTPILIFFLFKVLILC